MTIVDLHTHLPSEHSPQWADWRQTDVLRDMDSRDIDAAVVMTLDGLIGDPVRGNEIVEQACAGAGGRLVPACSVQPRDPGAADEIRRCADRGFRLIKLHPWLQGFSPLEVYMDPVAAVAIERGLPVIVHDGTPPYASPLQIAAWAARHPELTVILAHGGLFDLWQDAAAAALRHDNVHLTLCGSAPAATFRQVLGRIPAAKISIGTDTGFGDGDVADFRLAVHRALLAELDPADAAAIAAGNARTLLGLDR
jgi:uncharacterized protein